MDTLFNVNQVAFILKVHPLTVRRYILEEKLPAIKVGGTVRIKEADLNGFSKTFTVKHKQESTMTEKQTVQAKPFTNDDPFLRLEGRGTSLVSR